MKLDKGAGNWMRNVLSSYRDLWNLIAILAIWRIWEETVSLLRLMRLTRGFFLMRKIISSAHLMKRVTEMANKKFPLIRKKVFTLAWGGFCFVQKRVNANNGRWKRICRIKSSMRIKKVMWHLKCCYGHLEMPKQSLSSKYFCIIASQNCYTTAFPNSRHQLKQCPHSLCFVCSLWGTSHLLYMKIIIFSGFSYFLWNPGLWHLSCCNFCTTSITEYNCKNRFVKQVSQTHPISYWLNKHIAQLQTFCIVWAKVPVLGLVGMLKESE